MIRKDQNDTVSALALKYGSITVRTLRDYYGSFAPHCADESELGEILAGLDVASLTQIIRDYKSGRLEQICQPLSSSVSESHGHYRHNGAHPTCMTSPNNSE
jgi:hypothetical protein